MAGTPRSPTRSRPRRAAILDGGVHLVTLGGDHFVTWPLLQRARRQVTGRWRWSSSTRTRTPGTTTASGSITAPSSPARSAPALIDPARSIQVGIRTHAPEDCGIAILDAYAVHEQGVAGTVERILARVGGAPAYLTFDIDCLDPAFAPGTGTPVAGGLSSAQALMMLRGLGGVDWRGMDVVEVAPAYDHADITAIAAAAVVQHYLGIIEPKLARGGALEMT